MDKEKARQILITYNKWRTGAEIDPPRPTIVTEAINVLTQEQEEDTKPIIWLAGDLNGTERIFNQKPKRFMSIGAWLPATERSVVLPKGTIKKLIGRDLTFRDKPVGL